MSEVELLDSFKKLSSEDKAKLLSELTTIQEEEAKTKCCDCESKCCEKVKEELEGVKKMISSLQERTLYATTIPYEEIELEECGVCPFDVSSFIKWIIITIMIITVIQAISRITKISIPPPRPFTFPI